MHTVFSSPAVLNKKAKIALLTCAQHPYAVHPYGHVMQLLSVDDCIWSSSGYCWTALLATSQRVCKYNHVFSTQAAEENAGSMLLCSKRAQLCDCKAFLRMHETQTRSGWRHWPPLQKLCCRPGLTYLRDLCKLHATNLAAFGAK